MVYFDESFTRFFNQLKKQNHRDWFIQNKTVYEEKVKKPFEKLAGDLIGRMQKLHPGFELEIKDAIFRINRDIRFSADKSPYKTYVSAVIGAGGRKNMTDPGMYLQLEAGSISIFGGIYMPEKESLSKIRTAIMEQPEEVERLKKDKKFVAMYGKLQGETNKVLPPEFREAVKNEPLIAHKQFYFSAKYDDGKTLFRKDLLDFIMKHHEVGIPWTNFLYRAIHA